MDPRNQETHCPVCGIQVVIGEDTEDAECPNCTYQFRTPWGRIQDALKVQTLEDENTTLKEELRVGNHLLAVATDKERDLEADITKLKEQVLHPCITCDVFNVNDKLRAALRDFGQHSAGCNGPYGYPCKCGWEETKKLSEE